MSFKWSEFLAVAKGLCDEAKTADSSLIEAITRTVIGRAYYASFNSVREFLESERSSPFDDRDIHKTVLEELKKPCRSDRNSIAQKLQRQLYRRKSADYDRVFGASVRAGVEPLTNEMD